MKKTTFLDYVVRSNGKINIQDSLNKFRGDLSSLAEKEEKDNQEVFSAVNEVFNQNQGKAVVSDFIVNNALTRFNISPNEFKGMQDKIAKCVRMNTGKTRDDGLPFGMKKGTGGGFFRWTDSIK